MSYTVRSCFCARTDNHSPTRHYSVSAVFKVPIWATQFAVASALVQTSPTRHYPLRTMRCCANLLLSRFPWELTVLPWRLQTFSLWFKTQPQPNCLFESHSDPQVSYQHRALYKLFKIYWWITCGNKFNKYSKIHIFLHLFPVILFLTEKDG